MIGIHDPDLIGQHLDPLEFVSSVILNAQFERSVFVIGYTQHLSPVGSDFIVNHLSFLLGGSPLDADFESRI